MSHPLVVHCQEAAYDVYIGRGRGGIFGNPFSHLEPGKSLAQVLCGTREKAVELFRIWLAGEAYQELEPERRQAILDAIPTLKGKVLACWCAPQACHGDVLAELANAEVSVQATPARSPVPTCPPGNIYSGERSARTVLTNPTELAKRKGNLRHSYPVEIDGVVYPDAEEAYQQLKRGLGYFADLSAREDLCMRVIEAKLRQHPQLIDFIAHNGGASWLAQCRHFTRARTEAFSEWEGVGYESAFIRALIKAFARVRW